MNKILIQIICILLLFGVGDALAQEMHDQQSPAVVSGHPDEALVNTITLTEQAVKRLRIQTAQIRTDNIANTRVFGGTIMEPSGGNVQIVSPYDGVVLAGAGGTIPDPGSMLSRGEAILRLSVLPLPQQMQGASEVLDARATELDIARKRAERAEQLLKAGAGSLRDLENAQQILADSEAAYKAAETGGSLAISGSTDGATNLSTMTIAVPHDVIIKEIHVTAGQIVSAGMPLAELTNTGITWVRVPVFSGYQTRYSRTAGALIQGLGVSEKPPVSARSITGPLTAEPTTSSIDLYFELENNDRRFRPGERVSVRLSENTTGQRMVVPESAIFRDIQGGTWVYVVHDVGVYTRERVELEQIIEGLAVLRNGPDTGTFVVTVGVAELAGTEFGVAH